MKEADILLNIMEWCQSADGTAEAAETALATIRDLAKSHLLSECNIVALDPEMEEERCACGWALDTGEDPLHDGDKCPNCKREVRLIT
jgi:predicted Zn-ribbon and HTH transcriptional regulator